MNTKIKSVYIFPVALLMLAACSQEDPTTVSDNSQGERIIFHTSLPNVISRATEVFDNDIKAFHVTAFNPNPANTPLLDERLDEFINNVKLEKDEIYGFYSSESCKWPEKKHESDLLHFFAYYPDLNEDNSLENASTVNGNYKNIDYKLNNFKVAKNIADQVDFVTAYATGSMADNLFSGITLNFNHKLSRIEVKAKSSNKSCKLEIAGVRIGGICTQATYNFKAEDGAGDWTLSDDRDYVEYIYQPGDKIVALDNTETEVSIMGASKYAMLLPSSSYTAWDFVNDNTNSSNGMFISVLLRIIDKTPTAGNGKVQYPYFDNTQGLNAMNIPRVYLAVDNNGIVTANPGQLYKGDDEKYYTDETKTTEYTAPDGGIVKEFGWAALPVTVDWEAGRYYTYTLDYSYGVGLHDPSVDDPEDITHSPKAGDPIISDRVGVSVSVNDWQELNGTTPPVEVPGS